MSDASPSLAALAAYGADDRVVARFGPYSASDLIPGRVARVDRGRCLVATGGGLVAAVSDPLPVVGDWVAFRPGADSDEGPGAVEVVLPRWSELTRPAVGTRPGVDVVAANVDIVFVVVALDRDPNASRIERELVVAWDSGAQPVVVLNKADAVVDAEQVAIGLRARLGVIDVVVVSARLGAGIDELRAAARPSRTVVLIGPSGVGKSTIVNALVGDAVAATGAVREGDGRGRHTTTARSLVPIPGGGVLLDTPGVRSVGLVDTDDGMGRTFPEIDELALGCRYRNCAHGDEPGCAVTAAVAAGTLDAGRFASWQKLVRELADRARAADRKLEAGASQGWRAVDKAMKGRSRP